MRVGRKTIQSTKPSNRGSVSQGQRVNRASTSTQRNLGDQLIHDFSDRSRHLVFPSGKFNRIMVQHLRDRGGDFSGCQVPGRHHVEYFLLGYVGSLNHPSFSNPGLHFNDNIVRGLLGLTESEQLHLTKGVVAIQVHEPQKTSKGIMGLFSPKQADFMHVDVLIIPPSRLEHQDPDLKEIDKERVRIDRRTFHVSLNMNLPRETAERLQEAGPEELRASLTRLILASNRLPEKAGDLFNWLNQGLNLDRDEVSLENAYEFVNAGQLGWQNSIRGIVQKARGTMSHRAKDLGPA